MPRARLAILFAEEDGHHRAAAVAALEGFALTVTPLRPGSLLDPGAPVLAIWSARTARREGLARELLARVTDVVLWRPDGAPAPQWLAHAYPVGPEMPVRTLALMARLAVAEGERRARTPAPKRAPLRRRALRLAVGGGALLVVAGAAFLIVAHGQSRAALAPVTGLRGMQ